MAHEVHSIRPVFDEYSKILILGSFPSVKSRETQFFYGHPQNRFWKVLAGILDQDIPITIEAKKAFLLNNQIAVWDVIESCDIEGSSDSSIKNVTPNDINFLLTHSSIQKIFSNGGTSFRLYKKYCEHNTNIPSVQLPSTSPANAAFSLERLSKVWKQIIPFLS